MASVALHVRHAPLFAVTAVLALADLLPHSGVARALARRGYFNPGTVPILAAEAMPPPKESFAAAIMGLSPCASRAVVPAIVLGLGMLAQGFAWNVPLVGRGWARLDESYWPVAMVPALNRIGSSALTETRVFNDMLYGGFLIFYAPQMRVYVDDRCELFGASFLAEYANVVQREPAKLEGLADRWGIDYALTETGSAIDNYLAESPRWRSIMRSGSATLRERER